MGEGGSVTVFGSFAVDTSIYFTKELYTGRLCNTA